VPVPFIPLNAQLRTVKQSARARQLCATLQAYISHPFFPVRSLETTAVSMENVWAEDGNASLTALRFFYEQINRNTIHTQKSCPRLNEATYVHDHFVKYGPISL